MAERFYFSGQLDQGWGRLDADQAHHAMHVMRCGIGQQIVLFDQFGQEYIAEVVQLEKKALTFQVIETKPLESLPRPRIVIAAALPKGDRQKFMLEKLVELGVDSFIPLNTRRSVVIANSNTIQRIEKGIVEATKQCGRRRLMDVEPELGVEQLANYSAAVSAADGGAVLKLLADPYRGPRLGDCSLNNYSIALVAIGPEGGFEEAEIQLLMDCGWQSVQIGRTILRVETAAMAAATLLVSRREI